MYMSSWLGGGGRAGCVGRRPDLDLVGPAHRSSRTTPKQAMEDPEESEYEVVCEETKEEILTSPRLWRMGRLSSDMSREVWPDHQAPGRLCEQETELVTVGHPLYWDEAGSERDEEDDDLYYDEEESSSYDEADSVAETAKPQSLAEGVSVGSTAYSAVVHGGHPRKEEGTDAWTASKFAATYPRLSCWLLFCVNLGWVLVTLGLALAGLDPMNARKLGELGLVIPDEKYQLRANAVAVARDQADFSLLAQKCEQQDPGAPIQLILMKGRFDRVDKGNALTKRGLEALRDREVHVYQTPGWPERCAIVYKEAWPACERQPAVANYSITCALGCLAPWSPVLLFAKYGDPNFDDIAGTVAKIRAGGNDWQAFKDMLHADFDPDAETLRSKILVSQIFTGTPRDPMSEYLDSHDRSYSLSWYTDREARSERRHLANWIDDNLGSWLDRSFRGARGRKPFRTLYTYDLYSPVGAVVLQDLALLAVAALFVAGYIAFYTGSLFVAASSLFVVASGFFAANLFYRYCWPTQDGLGYDYFTLFCALALFIGLGVGVDDVFVYWDTWRGSATHRYKTVAHRISHVASHTAVAIGVTSLTTVLAFLSNLGSPFLGIRTFGIFSALLVFANYLIVVTMFPTVILVYDRYLAHLPPLSSFLKDAVCCRRSKCRPTTRSSSASPPLRGDTNAGGAAPCCADRPVVDRDDDARSADARSADEDDEYFEDELCSVDDDGMFSPRRERRERARLREDPLAAAAEKKIEPPPPPKTTTTTRKRANPEWLHPTRSNPANAETRGHHQNPRGRKRRADYVEPLPIWFRDRYGPWLLARKRTVASVLALVWTAFLGLATRLRTAPFREYDVLPASFNFHQATFVQERWRPESATPLQVSIAFGLDHRKPLSLHGVLPTDFVHLESGRAEWDYGFNMDPINSQLQFLRVANELADGPRSGLKVDVQYGVNPQLCGAASGSLEDVSDGGILARIKTPYGVQSLMHVLQQWSNASIQVDADKGAYKIKNNSPSKCRPCFDTFNVWPNPNDLGPYFADPETGLTRESFYVNATSKLNDYCDCIGIFPIPTDVCLFETKSNAPGTLFKCVDWEESVPIEIANFLNAGKTDADYFWWSNYIFAMTDNTKGRYLRLAMYIIQIQTTLSVYEGDYRLGLRMANKWDRWARDHNDDPNNPNKALVHIPQSPQWVVNSLLVPSAINSTVLSLFLAWTVLLIARGNWIIASVATLTIGMICTCILGFIQVTGWGLGPIEALLLVIVVGFSVDYTVHLADSYLSSRSPTREGKVMDALVHTGSSVLSGSISTMGASLPLFAAQVAFFFKFGTIVFLTSALSMIFALGFFAAILAIAGPLGTTGSLSQLYAGMVASMHERMRQLEEEQGLLAYRSASRVARRKRLPWRKKTKHNNNKKSKNNTSRPHDAAPALELHHAALRPSVVAGAAPAADDGLHDSAPLDSPHSFSEL